MGNESSRPKTAKSKPAAKNQNKAVTMAMPALKEDTSPLVAACQSSDLEAIKRLLGDPEESIDVRVKYQAPGTNNTVHRKVLHWICDHAHLELLTLIMERKDCDINTRNGKGMTPLQVALAMENISLVELVLSNPKVDVNKAVSFTPGLLNTLDYRTALGIALDTNSALAARKLLADRADTIDVNQITQFPYYNNAYGMLRGTPLYLAAQKGMLEIVKMLCGFDFIDLNLRSTPNDWSPLQAALNAKHPEVAKYLLSFPDIDPNQKETEALDKDNQPLFQCFVIGETEIARTIMEHPKFVRPKLSVLQSIVNDKIANDEDDQTKVEFVGSICAFLDIPPQDFFAEDDPLLPRMFSRKKSAYK